MVGMKPPSKPDIARRQLTHIDHEAAAFVHRTTSYSKVSKSLSDMRDSLGYDVTALESSQSEMDPGTLEASIENKLLKMTSDLRGALLSSEENVARLYRGDIIEPKHPSIDRNDHDGFITVKTAMQLQFDLTTGQVNVPPGTVVSFLTLQCIEGLIVMELPGGIKLVIPQEFFPEGGLLIEQGDFSDEGIDNDDRNDEDGEFVGR